MLLKIIVKPDLSLIQFQLLVLKVVNPTTYLNFASTVKARMTKNLGEFLLEIENVYNLSFVVESRGYAPPPQLSELSQQRWRRRVDTQCSDVITDNVLT